MWSGKDLCWSMNLSCSRDKVVPLKNKKRINSAFDLFNSNSPKYFTTGLRNCSSLKIRRQGQASSFFTRAKQKYTCYNSWWAPMRWAASSSLRICFKFLFLLLALLLVRLRLSNFSGTTSTSTSDAQSLYLGSSDLVVHLLRRSSLHKIQVN